MPYTYNKLKKRILELYGSQKEFAGTLGRSGSSVSKKINCKTGFSREDIVKWSVLLNVGEDEYGEYFFS